MDEKIMELYLMSLKLSREFYEKMKCPYLKHYNDMGANIYSCDALAKVVSDFTYSFYPLCTKCNKFKELNNVSASN